MSVSKDDWSLQSSLVYLMVSAYSKCTKVLSKGLDHVCLQWIFSSWVLTSKLKSSNYSHGRPMVISNITKDSIWNTFRWKSGNILISNNTWHVTLFDTVPYHTLRVLGYFSLQKYSSIFECFFCFLWWNFV